SNGGSWPWVGPAHLRRWCLSLVLRGEKSPRTRRPAPRVCSGPPPFRCGEVYISLSNNQDIFTSISSGKTAKSKSFFHAFQAPPDRLADGLLMHTLGLGNLFDAFAKNDVSIDPAALDLRQGVEGVPQTDEPLLELQNFLGSGLMQA